VHPKQAKKTQGLMQQVFSKKIPKPYKTTSWVGKHTQNRHLDTHSSYASSWKETILFWGFPPPPQVVSVDLRKCSRRSHWSYRKTLKTIPLSFLNYNFRDVLQTPGKDTTVLSVTPRVWKENIILLPGPI